MSGVTNTPAQFEELHRTRTAAREAGNGPSAAADGRQLQYDRMILEAIKNMADAGVEKSDDIIGWLKSKLPKAKGTSIALRDRTGRVVTVALPRPEQMRFVLDFAERHGRSVRALSGGVQMLNLALDFSEEATFNGIKAICTWIGEQRRTTDGYAPSLNVQQTRQLREVLEADDAAFRPPGPVIP